MRLFEAIIDANHRAVAGDNSAGLHPADFADELPVIALTCIDPRLNALFPNVLGLPGEEFIWLRNAGNIITGPLSSTMRSLALACAVKGGKEIAIIGHTDCQVCKTTASQLLDRLKALGVERSRLPDNLNEFFGMFATERQNVIKACDFIRQSPLIGPIIFVHGLLVDIETGKLDWVVNGYEARQLSAAPMKSDFPKLSDASNEELGSGPMAGFHFGEMKFPESKIGEASVKIGVAETKPLSPPPVAPRMQPLPAATAVPPKIPVPPPLRARVNVPFGRR
ncbi:MAG TPA: carbonic anhydrase [Candidatus Paceibacterota bacterium]|nr:carbonic anhydrase [Candidatus Paceibacterota bacterium]